MDTRKSENVKGSSQRSLIVLETTLEIRKCHLLASLELISMQFPLTKQCLIASRAASIFVRDIGRDNLFQCLTNLTKYFFRKSK